MLGTIYAATTFAGWAMYITAAVGMSARFKREGYELKKNDKSTPEKIIDLAKTFILMSIPGLNLLIGGISMFKFDEVYTSIKEKWIAQGKAVLKEEKENKPNKEVEIDLLSKDNNNPKRYTELSNEQKLSILEEEKARLLREKENQTKTQTEPYNYRGAYRK